MTSKQRLVLLIAIMASSVAFLDGSVINVALPDISDELGGGLVTQQWVVDAYLITLGALMLLAGSFSDLFGRKKILWTGLVGFGVTSVLCAIAPTSELLIVSRALQGVAGALLVPSSLALIIAAFRGAAQGKAIGSWTAWTGISFVIGPLVGGFLVDAASWRLIFAINVVLIAGTLWLLSRLELDERRDTSIKLDVVGAVLCSVGLGGVSYALIEQSHLGWHNPLIYLTLIGGIISLVGFVWHEARTAQPMLPLSLFKIRNFSVGNLATVSIYAALSISTFMVIIFIQQVGHYSAVQAGLSFLPVTIIMFLLSPRFGALAGKYGPRFFMAAGPVVAALGFLTFLNIDPAVSYWTHVFPGVIIFGLGLSMTVAPLTAAILGVVGEKQAGIGSAINNAVARIAGLLGVAMIGIVTGSTLDFDGFKRGIVAMVALLLIGGIISMIGISNTALVREES
ncbi:MAG TPA: MFS transporter [Candidatus Saccharimonadales bacterium]